jgi:tetratricopeptide (TPR) repeat protein
MGMRRMAGRAAVGLLVAVCLAACASRTPPPAPSAPHYPDFIYPAVPVDLSSAPGADRVASGWRFLQAGNLRNAERDFAAALKRTPGLYPAQAGLAYVELAGMNYERARAAFELALGMAPRYAPALVGSGQALLGLRRDGDALAAFEAALSADPSLMELGPRIDVLRFRNTQALIARARTAANAGQLDDARSAYEQALMASPESAFLYRELGAVERRSGNVSAALERFRRATALEPRDAVSFVQIGEILEEMMDFAGAATAYRAASAIEPTPAITARLDALAARAREAQLPEQFRALPAASSITRGDLAALIGIRLQDLLQGAQRAEQVMTDVRGHWAATWTAEVVRAGIMDAFENHTFQPAARVRRADLAVAVGRLLTRLAATRPELRARLNTRPTIADVAPRYLEYPQIAASVASGVMPLLPGNRFDVTRPVSGAEAVDTIARLRALAGPPR